MPCETFLDYILPLHNCHQYLASMYVTVKKLSSLLPV